MCRVKRFVESLDRSAQVRYGVKFLSMAEHGRVDGKNGHPLGGKNRKSKDEDGLSEFKDNASKSRILYFPEGAPGVLVLVHAFGGKKEDRIDPSEIAYAARVRDEYFRRLSVKTIPTARIGGSGGAR